MYDSDTPGSVVAPDGYIVFGVDVGTIKRDRRSYRIAEWGPPPAFVLEVASESTASRDLNEKRDIYARMQAQEYWRLDRRGAYYGENLWSARVWSTANTSAYLSTPTPMGMSGPAAMSLAWTSYIALKRAWGLSCSVTAARERF